MTSEVETTQLMNKLETIKDIRQKTIQVEKLRSRLRNELNTRENEDKCLDEYRTELELLLQEKMAHVEELRLIHADINLLETTIKQAEEERNRSVENAKKVYSDYVPAKQQLDELRSSVGLESLPNFSEEGDVFSAELLERHTEKCLATLNDSAVSGSSISMDVGSLLFPHAANTAPRHPYAAAGAHPFFSMAGLAAVSAGLTTASASAAVQTLPPGGVGVGAGLQSGKAAGSVGSMGSVAGASGGLGSGGRDLASASTSGMGTSAHHSAFRQQPPPMKACLSCHQQIHRNAPICPLCKAKSRSRNPKKPKRKLDE